ncbi:MAG: radical SAM-linked protein [Fusobacteria bacterium]|nr:MAG: radical SAM-linked protein [Fusobacteriota bacterium]KAF0230038.1 MAG: radical SAM-linked [Fusobacteriota bacterium]
MASYVMEFSVRGPLAYLSHLELMKVFRQSFRRSTLPISFSEGFNPHMKLSFAIAKGVGLESEGELLEIETDQEIDVGDFLEKINKVIPDGLKVKTLKEKTISTKSLSSMLRKAKYLLVYGDGVNRDEYRVIIADKLDKSEILMEVKTKKSIGIKDIKEYILDWNFTDTGVIIEVYAGSDKNLRIDNLLKYLELDLKTIRLKLIGDDAPIIDKMSKEE